MSSLMASFRLEVTVCLRDLLNELTKRGVTATDCQIRWAIRTGKVTRPELDGSLRFNYSDENLQEIAEYFTSREPRPCP